MQSRSFTVGSEGDQNFRITNRFVSRRHARITYRPGLDHPWLIEDLESTNGTFVQEPDGSYIRIVSKEVAVGTWIKLGGEKSGVGHRFLVDHLLGEADDYNNEFLIIAAKLEEYKARNAEVAEIARKRRLKFQGLTLGATAILAVAGVLTGKPFMYGASALTGCLGFLSTYRDKGSLQKEVNEKYAGYFACPCCGKPLSESAINAMECQACHTAYKQ